MHLPEGLDSMESLKAFSIHSSNLCVNSLTSCWAPVWLCSFENASCRDCNHQNIRPHWISSTTTYSTNCRVLILQKKIYLCHYLYNSIIIEPTTNWTWVSVMHVYYNKHGNWPEWQGKDQYTSCWTSGVGKISSVVPVQRSHTVGRVWYHWGEEGASSSRFLYERRGCDKVTDMREGGRERDQFFQEGNINFCLHLWNHRYLLGSCNFWKVPIIMNMNFLYTQTPISAKDFQSSCLKCTQSPIHFATPW